MTAKDWLNDLCALKRWRAHMLAPMAGAVAKEVPERYLSQTFAEAVAAKLDGVPTLGELLAAMRATAPDTSADSRTEAEKVAEAWIVGTRQRLAKRPDLLDQRLSLARHHAPREAYEAICREHAPHVLEAERRHAEEVADFRRKRAAQRVAEQIAARTARAMHPAPTPRPQPFDAPPQQSARKPGHLRPEHLIAARNRLNDAVTQ